MGKVTEVLVCDSCLRASCWYGEAMCEAAKSVGTVVVPIAKLRRMKLEHPYNWTRAKFDRVYGDPHPTFKGERRWGEQPPRPTPTGQTQ